MRPQARVRERAGHAGEVGVGLVVVDIMGVCSDSGEVRG